MIDTEEKLKANLKLLKMKMLKSGCTKFSLYPIFCLYYEKYKDRYLLPKKQVFDVACEILIEEDE